MAEKLNQLTWRGCARRIKAIRSHSRIILISAYPDREFHRQGLQSGAVAFLDKKTWMAPMGE